MFAPAMFAPEARFYVTGGTLRPDAPSYVTRAADRELQDALLAGEYCYVLTSRQMGKSSLMVRTAARLREAGLTVVILDLTSLGQNLSVEQWYYGLLAAIGRQTGLRAETGAFWRENPALSPLQRWIGAVREVVLPHCPGGLVLFIDEIDAVRGLPFSSDEFFAAIRECYNQRPEEPDLARLAFCLLGVATPADLIRDRRLTPFNIGRRIELRDFALHEAAPLALGLPQRKRVVRELMQRVFYWTGGHPYLTQLVCHALASNPSLSRARDVDRLVEGLFLAPGARDQEDNLLFVREQLLADGVDRVELLETYARVLSGRRVPDDPENPLLDRLRLAGVVRPERSRLRPRNRVYHTAFDRRWVRDQMPDAELRRQRAAFFRGLTGAAALAAVVVAVTAALAVAAVGNEQRANRLADRWRHELSLKEEALQKLQRALGEVERERNLARAQAERAQRAERREAGERRRAVSSQRQAEIARTQAEQQRRLALARSLEASRQQVVAEEQRDRQRTLLIRSQVANGWKRADDGDLFGSLLWFAEALDMVQGDPEAERMHRLRIGSLLAQAPRLAATWHLPAPGNLAFFSGDGTQALTATREGAVVVRSSQHPTRPPTSWAGSGRILATAPGETGERLLVARGNAAFVVEARSGRTLLGPLHHGHPVTCGSFGIGTGLVATADNDGTARVWDAGTGQPRYPPIRHGPNIWECAISRDGKTLATFNSDGDVRTWALDETVQPLPCRPGGGVTRLRLSPDGNRLAVTTAPHGEVRVWDVRVGHPATRVLAGGIIGLAFSADSKQLLTLGDDGAARLWDPESGRPLLPPLRHGGPVYQGAFSADGSCLVTASEDGTARVWSTATGVPLAPPLPHPTAVTAASLDREGRRVLAVCRDGTARLWDLAGGDTRGYPLELSEVAHLQTLSPDGQVVATAGDPVPVGKKWEVPVRLWDTKTRTLLHPALMSGADFIRSVAFSPDGEWVVTASEDQVRVWSRRTGARVGSALPHPAPVHQACFSTDGRLLITGGADGIARIWDWREGRCVVPPLRNHSDVLQVRFTPDGRQALTFTGRRTFHAWDVRTGERLPWAVPDQPRLSDFAISPDSRRLAVSTLDGTAEVFDLEQGRSLVRSIRHDAAIYRIRFSPDSTRILTAGEDRSARIWDARTGEPVTPPLHHRQSVTDATFSADGRLLLTCCSAGAGRVWDTRTGEPLTLPLSLGHPARLVAFSPDATTAVVVGSDSRAAVWELSPLPGTPENVLALAQYLTGQRLDKEGGRTPLTPDELGRLETVCLGVWPRGQATLPDEVLAWRRREAAAGEAAGHWTAASRHLDSLTDAAPDEWRLFRRRARARCETGDWSGAAADLERLEQLGHGDRITSYFQALARLGARDYSGYRDVCERMLSRYSDFKEARNVDITAWTCALGPLPRDVLERAIHLAEELVRREPANPEYHNTLGALLYRSGRYEAGLEQLRSAVGLRGGETSLNDRLLLTILFARCNRTSEARQMLDRIVAELAHLEAVGTGGWDDRLEHALLLSEIKDSHLGAERSLEAANSPPKEKPTRDGQTDNN